MILDDTPDFLVDRETPIEIAEQLRAEGNFDPFFVKRTGRLIGRWAIYYVVNEVEKKLNLPNFMRFHSACEVAEKLQEYYIMSKAP